MEEEFRLIYFHKETGREYRAKMVTRLDYIMIEQETGKRFSVSRYRLRKEYRSDPSNSKVGDKNRLRFKRSA